MKKFGLIGFPLIHSFSKKYFTEKFENENIDAQYDLYELDDISKFNELISSVELSGLNVTIPYKEKVIPFLNELDETAARIGAVNVIQFRHINGKSVLKGYNSDTIGFEASIKPLLLPRHSKALILGTGGASKAIVYALQKLGIETTFVSRSSRTGCFTYQELNKEIIEEYKLIINASPVGTFPHTAECPDIPYHFIGTGHLVFDVVYNPAETQFLAKAKAQGATTINGEGMLTGQAVAAWRIWNEI